MAVLSKSVTSTISEQICSNREFASVHFNKDQKSIQLLTHKTKHYTLLQTLIKFTVGCVCVFQYNIVLSLKRKDQ